MTPSEPQPSSIADVVIAFNDCVNRRDMPGLTAWMAEEIVFENTFPSPDGTRYEGRDAVLAFWQDFFQSSPNALFEIEEVIAAGERCTVRWRYIWDAQAGKNGYVRGVDLFRVRNGKITEKLSYVKG